MQAKGLVTVFGVLLLLVCLIQLSFTFIANRVEKKAENYAAEKYSNETQATEYSTAKFNYLDSVSTENVFLGYTYDDVKQRKLNLGLDLQGGMSAVLQVSLEDMIKSMAANKEDPVLTKALEEAKKMQKDSQEDLVTLFGQAFERQNPDSKLAALFQRPEYRDQIQFQSPNSEVLDFIRTESKEAVQRTFKILRSRIDRFGVAQPNINLVEASNRIVVELPGVGDPERVRKLLQATAKLEFWETYQTGPEYFEMISKVNDAVADKLGVKKEDKADEASTAPDVDEATATPNEEASNDSITVAEDAANDTTGLADKDTTSLADKTDDIAPSDSLTQEERLKQNPFFAIFQPSQYQGSAIVGFINQRDTAQFREYLNYPEVRRIIPPELKLLLSAKPQVDEDGNPSNVMEVYGVKSRAKDKRPALEGDVIVDARSDLDPTTQRRVVNMRMNSEGAKAWKKITASNIDKSVAIVLDDRVYSAPVVRSEIAGGSSEISGNFTTAEADDLANILKAGKLPAPARIVEEAIVGPSLGASSIRAGLLSLIAGLLLVLLFMIFYYNKGGWVADLALILNLFFVIGILASLGATLTLPGMAGIVLTIGMAVDANVIIFERIREELANGSSVRKAIADGYTKSYSAIIDANLTTLITAAILFYFGLGPVLGFATVLMIGIFSSLFTAILVTRLVIDWYVGKGNEMSFFNKFTEGTFQNTNYDFLSKRKITYTLSAIIIGIGLISMFTRGFDLGVDFEGGNTYVVEFAEPVNTSDLVSALAGPLDGAPEVISYGEGGKSVKIKTSYLVDSEDKDAGEKVERQLHTGLQPLPKRSVFR